jgi:hypothetical protein
LNNNRNNNRRRGRGNRQQGGNGQQLNRIDSRARGNAPQLLEKYRKLAHDAHLNGDRVQAEYYLQFADHYFRVLADQRLRQEELRRPRDERFESGSEGERDEGGDDLAEFPNDSDFPAYDQAPAHGGNRPARQGQDERGRDDREERGNWQQRRPERDERPGPQERDRRPTAEQGTEAESGERNPFEPIENPFVRGSRGLRPRREDRDRSPRGERDAPGIDPGILPPPIALAPEGPMADDEQPVPKKPRGRPRKPKAEDGTGEALESVG